MLNEHDKHCKSIAKELEQFHNGALFYYAGDCYPTDPDSDFWKKEGNGYGENEEGEKYYKIDNEIILEYDVEPATIYDYFRDDDICDIEYTVTSEKEYKSVCLMIAYGGPNIYIDTNTGNVELYWWGERGSYPISPDVIEAIDEYWEEMYNSF